MMDDASKEIVLSNKKKEERKRQLLKLISTEKFDIIRNIESLRIPHTKLGLTLSNPSHRQWLEEFTVIFDDNGDDELIEISMDQVDIYINDHGESILRFDFDDILENEPFNIDYKMALDDIVDQEGHFDINLFIELLKASVQTVIKKMVEFRTGNSI